jgi:hypothetical protein
MFSAIRRLAPFGLGLSATLITSIFASPQAARALNVVVQGTTYDLQLYSGSYTSNPSFFQSTASGGRMPWWGNPSLADDLAGQLANGLSPTYADGDPVEGPLFATAFHGLSIGSEITSSFFDLSTLGITDVVTTGSFDSSSTLSYAVVAAPAPAPLPILGVAAGFSASRRLRRRVLQHKRQQQLKD